MWLLRSTRPVPARFKMIRGTSTPLSLQTTAMTWAAWVGRSVTRTSSSLGETMSHQASEEFRAVKITVAGVVEKVSLDRSQLLQSLYAQIGCRYVEVVQPTDTICLWVDEEGLINRSEPNLVASFLAA